MWKEDLSMVVFTRYGRVFELSRTIGWIKDVCVGWSYKKRIMTEEDYNLFIAYCQTGKHRDLKAADYQKKEDILPDGSVFK